MVIDNKILDELSVHAKANARLRTNLDLRNSPEDQSQRMLNAVEPGTVVPIHRHMKSSETVVCVRGHFEELLFSEVGSLEEVVDMFPCGPIVNIPIGKWHTLRSLETGTVLLECKDGAYEPLNESDILIH